ncbi:MAG: HAD-IA family hydrolase [Bdellovibrionota bacterium]
MLKLDPALLKKKFCYGTQSLLTDYVGADPRLHKAIYADYIAHYRDIMFESPLFEGVTSLLADLEGQKKMAILTNKREQTSLTLLKHYAIDQLFTPIIGGDTLSVKKPSPIPIEHICQHLQIAPAQTLMVGDSHADILAGNAAGTTTLGVLNGFTTSEMLQEAQPDLIIKSIAEMRSLLR